MVADRSGSAGRDWGSVMRIAYGVHGYSRGHATRALAVLPELKRRHEVMVFAGGDALPMLASRFSVRPIPYLTYVYDRRGRISKLATIAENSKKLLDLWGGGPSMRSSTSTTAAINSHHASNRRSSTVEYRFVSMVLIDLIVAQTSSSVGLVTNLFSPILRVRAPSYARPETSSSVRLCTSRSPCLFCPSRPSNNA